MNEEEDYIEIDEDTVTSVKWGIVKYIAIFIIFVFIPLMITVLTSKSLTKLNVFAGFMGITIICIDQIKDYGAFLASLNYYEEEEN